MPEFKKLKLKQFPLAEDRETSEAKFWKSYAISAEDTLLGAPTCIDFNPMNSSSYLVTSSTRVSLYDSASDKVLRAFSRFPDEAFSGRHRKDGKLFVAGDKSGAVKVFDIQTKAMLRNLTKHSAAVRATVWTADGIHFVSGSDDRKVKLWDIGTQEVTWEGDKATGHSDYVRSVDSSQVSADVFVSAGYDHCVKVWDKRQASPVHSLSHSAPVETCVLSPSGTLLMTSAGNEVKVWDMISSGKLLHTFSSHQKNVTGLVFDSASSRLLSCGLDGLVKIYSLQTLQVTHGMRFGSALTTISVSPNGRKLVVGFADGKLLVRTKAGNNLLSSRSADPEVVDSLSRKRQLSMDETLDDGIIAEEYGVEETNYDLLKNKHYKGAGKKRNSCNKIFVFRPFVQKCCRCCC